MKFFHKLLAIIKKDFKILSRSKTSALVLILGPLLVVLLLGFAFNTSGLYDINVGAYSDSYSELSNSLIEQLKTNYGVEKIESKDDCIKEIKTGSLHVCLVFPADMQVSNEKTNEVEFYVDYSRINLAYTIMESITGELETKSSEMSLDMTKKVVETLNSAKDEIGNKQGTVSNIISNSGEAIGKVDSAYTSFSSLDINYSASNLNVTNLDSTLEAEEAEHNETFSELRSAVDEFKSSVSTIFAKFELVRANRETILGNLEGLKTTLETDKGNLEGVKGSMDKVVGDINSISVTKAESIVVPFSTSIKPVVSEKTHLGNMFPALVVLVIMFIAILLSSTLVMQERLNKAYFRNFISPTGDSMFLLASFITNFLIILIQMIVIFGVSLFFFKGEILGVLLNSGIALLLIISVFIFLGMLIGYIFKSGETTTLGALFVASILLFFSNTILPLESLPEKIKAITLFNPFVVSQELLKGLMLFNLGLGDVLRYVIILLAFLGVFASLTFLARELTKRMQY